MMPNDNTELNLGNFRAWQEQRNKLREAREWLAHIGKVGRSTRDHTDILRLSPAHCATPAFTISGQYTEGGTNYRESPKSFNESMQAVVLRHFDELSKEAMTLLERQTAEALVKAEGEIEAIQAAIVDAKTGQRT